MSGAAPLQLLWPLAVDGELPDGLAEGRPEGLDPARVLGEIRFGKAAGADRDLPGHPPCLRVRTPTLVPAQPWRALWVSDGPLTEGVHGRVRYRHDERLLFGTIAVDESGFVAVDGASALQQAATEAYDELFAALGEAQFPGLLRVWNFLPRINEVDNGIERYRQFNIGRQHAFAACGRELTGRVPAASALGVDCGPLEIGFFATRGPLLAVENPRQVSAYHYPAEYGPRSPTFSRAVVASLPGQDLLFVSGTASIVGHQTLHPDDVAAQTRETLVNLDTVQREAGRTAAGLGSTVADLCCLAYVRHAADLPAVRAEVQTALGEDTQVCYVQADVCRADLLVEIEASGGHPTQGLMS